MIIFNKVSMKNFFSIGNVPIVIRLDEFNTTLITGENGAGKSTISNAIYFCLFNKLFKDLPKPSCINSINDKDTVVELEFRKGENAYKVIRGLKPTKFEIHENGVLMNQSASARDYQKFFEEEILDGLNANVFEQVVMVGSSSYIPFMKLPTATRKEVIEELLDLKIFSNMLDKVKEKISSYKDKLKIVENDLHLTSEKIKIYKDNKVKKLFEQNERTQQLQNSISTYQEEINVSQSKLTLADLRRTEVKAKMVDVSPIKATLEKNRNLMSDFKAQKTISTKTLEFFTKHDNCPTCNQAIETSYKENIKSTEVEAIQKYDLGLGKITSNMSKLEKSLEENSEILREVEKLDREIYKHQTDIKSNQNSITQAQKEITNITQNKVDSDDNILEELEEKFKKTTEDKITFTEDKKYYDIISILLKDSGVKSKIIKQYIPAMNKIVNEYLDVFGLPIEFTLDEDFNETIKSRYRDTFKYDNFSDGERQRIDLALLFAWREIAKSKNTTNCNLLFFDEVMDKSLDGTALETLLDILTMKMDKSNIFVISHRGDEYFDQFDNTIKVSKVGNFTQLI